MPSSAHRLTKRGDIEKVLRRGKTVHGDYLTIKVAQNNREALRFTVVVSLKVSKKAIERNKVRRRVREIMRTEITPSVTKPADVAILLKKSSLDASYEELKKTLVKAFQKTRLLES